MASADGYLVVQDVMLHAGVFVSSCPLRSGGDGGSHDVHAGLSDHCLHGTRRLQTSQLRILLGLLVSSLTFIIIQSSTQGTTAAQNTSCGRRVCERIQVWN